MLFFTNTASSKHYKEFTKAECNTKRYITHVLSSYETNVTQNINRNNNIRLGASKINGYILLPNVKFSFNDVVGPRTEEAGFLKAPEFVAGAKVDGVGGGICQVSSTLYMAARLGWLKVIRRYSHSRPVSYIPPGTDAAVAYGSLDLILKNPYTVPLTIQANLVEDKLVVSIIGFKPNFTVHHKYTWHKPLPPPIQEISSKFLKNKKLFQTGKPGMAGTSIWMATQDGVEADRVVSISNYKPVPEIWLVPVGL